MVRLGVLVSSGCHNKVPWAGRLKQWKFIYSQFERGKFKIKVSVESVSLWSFSPCLADSCLLAVSSLGLSTMCIRVHVLISSSCPYTSHIGLGPTFTTSFYQNYLFLPSILSFFFIYLFIWLHQVLVAAGGLLSCGMHVASSSLTRDQTWSPCVGRAES